MVIEDSLEGGSFDLIIDDGVPSHIQISFIINYTKKLWEMIDVLYNIRRYRKTSYWRKKKNAYIYGYSLENEGSM
jgi:hypothetical protein